MVKAYNPNARFQYVLAVDRALPSAEQTVFVFRQLTMQDDLDIEDETGHLFDEQTSEGGAKTRVLPNKNLNAYARAVLSRALVSWTPMPSDEGDPVVLERDEKGAMTDRSFNALGRNFLELFNRARKAEELTPIQAGKS